MKLGDLKRIPPPPPAPEREACRACQAFAAECIVPVGESSAPMCWLCAHHVVDHERAFDAAATAACKCSTSEIYPNRDPNLLTADEMDDWFHRQISCPTRARIALPVAAVRKN